MKQQKLIKYSTRQLVDKFGCSKEQAEDFHQRATGKSTILALQFIAQAMLNPDVTIKIFDHHTGAYATQAHCELTRNIMSMARDLGLVGFTSVGKNTILYNPKELQKKIWGFELD